MMKPTTRTSIKITHHCSALKWLIKKRNVNSIWRMRKLILYQKRQLAATIVDEAAQKKHRRRFMIGVLLLLIAVGVGGLMAGLFTNKSSRGKSFETSMSSMSPVPSEEPSLSPSAAPTICSDECADARFIGRFPFFESSGRTDLAAEMGDDSQAMACPLLSGFDRGT